MLNTMKIPLNTWVMVFKMSFLPKVAGTDIKRNSQPYCLPSLLCFRPKVKYMTRPISNQTINLSQFDKSHLRHKKQAAQETQDRDQ